MKTLKKIVLSLFVVLFATSLFAQSYVNQRTKNTKLSQLLGQPGTMTSAKYWDLGEIDGEDKFLAKFQAVEIGDNKVSDVTKGIKVTILDDNKKTEAQLSSLFYFGELETFIDVSEFDDILTSLNYMINTLNIWGSDKMDQGKLVYRTQDNFIFGFNQEGKKQFGMMKIQFDRVEFSCELKKLEKSLEDLKGFIETAANELYIDTNLEKYEQSKKEEEERLKEAEKARKEKEKESKKDDEEEDSEVDDQL